jgi:hypothetical protein
MKIPPFVFTTIVFSPLILYFYLPKGTDLSGVLSIFKLVSYLSSSLWISSVIEYMYKESDSSKYRLLCHAINIIIAVIAIFPSQSPESFLEHSFLDVFIGFMPLALYVTNVIFITLMIKRVFYARSMWFIIVELILLPFGMFTLTSEIQNWEKEKKLVAFD